LLTESPRVIFCGESPLTNSFFGAVVKLRHWACSIGRYDPLGMPGWGRFFMSGAGEGMRGKRKRALPTETPQHDYHIIGRERCQLSAVEKLWFLRFIPFIRKLFV